MFPQNSPTHKGLIVSGETPVRLQYILGWHLCRPVTADQDIADLDWLIPAYDLYSTNPLQG